MKETIKKSQNFSNRDAINCKSGMSLQDIEDGGVIEIKAAATMLATDDDDENATPKNISVFVTTTTEYYTAISATVFDVTPDVIALLDEEDEPIKLRINHRSSKGGRDFLTVTVL